MEHKDSYNNLTKWQQIFGSIIMGLPLCASPLLTKMPLCGTQLVYTIVHLISILIAKEISLQPFTHTANNKKHEEMAIIYNILWQVSIILTRFNSQKVMVPCRCFFCYNSSVSFKRSWLEMWMNDKESSIIKTLILFSHFKFFLKTSKQNLYLLLSKSSFATQNLFTMSFDT